MNTSKSRITSAAAGDTSRFKKQTPKQSQTALEKRSISAPQREVLKAEVEAELLNRNEKIAHRAPPRGLLLKQRKLLTAAKMNNMQLIRLTGFRYYEPDVNAHDERNNTPLYYAAMNGNIEFCQFLLDHGARVNDPCEKGNTPLHMAFLSDKEAVNDNKICS